MTEDQSTLTKRSNRTFRAKPDTPSSRAEQTDLLQVDWNHSPVETT